MTKSQQACPTDLNDTEWMRISPYLPKPSSSVHPANMLAGVRFLAEVHAPILDLAVRPHQLSRTLHYDQENKPIRMRE
jgi:hypothetical protein